MEADAPMVNSSTPGLPGDVAVDFHPGVENQQGDIS
jgi:hypothetical protein